MVSAIGPFSGMPTRPWLVLAVGLLLVAFPCSPHGVIRRPLYFPVPVLMIGLILRGVASRVPRQGEPRRQVRPGNRMFFIGSMDVGPPRPVPGGATCSGSTILGLDTSLASRRLRPAGRGPVWPLPMPASSGARPGSSTKTEGAPASGWGRGLDCAQPSAD